MRRLPDLVRDSELDTDFRHGLTVHKHHESGSGSDQRVILREEFWRQKRQIGSGGFGCVWLEECVAGGPSGTLRAVKTITVPKQNFTDPAYVRELEAIAKFSHRRYDRCFVKSLGWYRGRGNLSIAMEYCELGDLQSYSSTHPSLPEPEVQEITFQVLEGLQFMHENEFAHRDLKPGNILIKAAPPNRWWVKIADFGISKRIEDTLGMPSTRKGTPHFMPPELFRQTGQHTAEDPYGADLWSLGEIVFRLLTKQPRFKGDYEFFLYIQNPQPVAFSHPLLKRPNITDHGQIFIQSVTTRSPAERLTAQQALSHDWLERCRSSTPGPTHVTRPDGWDTPTGLESLVLSEPSGSWSSSHQSNATSPMMSLPFAGDRTIQNDLARLLPPLRRMRGDSMDHAIYEGRQLLSSEVPPLLKTRQFHGNSQSRQQGAPVKSPEKIRLGNGQRLKGQTNVAVADTVTFSLDGRRLMSYCTDHTVGIWNIMAKAQVKKFKVSGHANGGCAFSPDGRKVAVITWESYGRVIEVWDLTGNLERTLRGSEGTLTAVAFSPDGKSIASGSHDATVRIWNLTTEKCVQVFEGHKQVVATVAFSPDGKWVASGSRDTTVRIWDLATEKCVQVFEGHQLMVTTVSFSPDGKWIVSGSRDETVRVWDLATGSSLRMLEGDKGVVNAVAISPDGKWLASGCHKAVQLWSMATGSLEQTPENGRRGLRNGLWNTNYPFSHSVAFSPDGRQLASGSGDKSIRLWDVVTVSE